MGFLGFGNYDKPGRGVDKDEPEKRSLLRFFELYFRKFWKIMNIAMIYFFMAIPMFFITLAGSFFVVNSFCNMDNGALKSVIENWFGSYSYFLVLITFFISTVYTAFIGAGPVSAGASYVLGSFAGDYSTFIWEDFKEKTKENLKQALAVYFIDLAVFMLLCYSFMIYYGFGGILGYLRYIVIVVAILFSAMHLYIYPMLVSYELKIGQIYKNALILTMAHLPVNLILLAIILAIHYGIVMLLMRFVSIIPLFLLIELFLGYGLTGFITNFRSEVIFKKYFKNEGEN